MIQSLITNLSLFNRPHCGSFLFLVFMVLGVSQSSFAIYKEIGLNYSYKRNYFDEFNNSEQQATQASVSFYLWERIALELSYTAGLAVQKDKQPNLLGAALRTTTSYIDAYGADLIFVFAEKTSKFQPFIKGGVAQVRRKVVIQDDGNNPWEILYSGMAPGYGIGCKMFITESFAIKTSYDFLQTPSNSDTSYSETNGRAGITWAF